MELVEPQSTAIAKLTAYAVCAAVQEEFNSPKETAAEDEPQVSQFFAIINHVHVERTVFKRNVMYA